MEKPQLIYAGHSKLVPVTSLYHTTIYDVYAVYFTEKNYWECFDNFKICIGTSLCHFLLKPSVLDTMSPNIQAMKDRKIR